MKRKMTMLVIFALIAGCSILAGCGPGSAPAEKKHMYDKAVITQISDYSDSTGFVQYSYQQELTYTYSGNFIAPRNAFNLHDTITFAPYSGEVKKDSTAISY